MTIIDIFSMGELKPFIDPEVALLIQTAGNIILRLFFTDQKINLRKIT